MGEGEKINLVNVQSSDKRWLFHFCLFFWLDSFGCQTFTKVTECGAHTSLYTLENFSASFCVSVENFSQAFPLLSRRVTSWAAINQFTCVFAAGTCFCFESHKIRKKGMKHTLNSFRPPKRLSTLETISKFNFDPVVKRGEWTTRKNVVSNYMKNVSLFYFSLGELKMARADLKTN